jgi:hypothetical protein
MRAKVAPSAALAPAADVAKVFLSYSRKDVSLADDMVAGPQAYGFEADIDREDIAPGEAREARLSGLIAERDTVVYVISPGLVSSPQCHREVTETLRLSKRLLPVVWVPVPEAQMPKELSRLNFVFFESSRLLARSRSVLVGRRRRRCGAGQSWTARGTGRRRGHSPRRSRLICIPITSRRGCERRAR